MVEFYEANGYVIVKDKCGHCGGTGKCNTERNGFSCVACHKYNNVEPSPPYKGLPCSICGGTGWVIKKIKIKN